MKIRRAALVLITLTFLGFAGACCGLLNPASRLYGTWKLDIETSIDKAAGGNDIQAGLMRAAWGMIGGDVIVEFRSDGTASFSGNSMFGAGQQEGTWKLLSSEGDVLKIEVVGEDGAERKIDVRMIDADTFEIDTEGERIDKIYFRRQKDQ